MGGGEGMLRGAGRTGGGKRRREGNAADRDEGRKVRGRVEPRGGGESER